MNVYSKLASLASVCLSLFGVARLLITHKNKLHFQCHKHSQNVPIKSDINCVLTVPKSATKTSLYSIQFSHVSQDSVNTLPNFHSHPPQSSHQN